MNKVLIIDDEEKLRNLLSRIVKLEGYTVIEAGNFKTAYALLEKEEIDVILCDVKLPDGSGLEFIAGVRKQYPLIETIMLTAYGNIPDAIQAMKNGAFDYITKGDDNAKVIPLLNKAFEKVSLHKRVKHLENLVLQKYNFGHIIGISPAINEAILLAKKVAPTDATVLLLGETGTGKEVFAQAIHSASARSNNPFLAINCSAFTRELLESEIFGHKAGAFTGAVKDKRGLIEEANKGTIFLDEIGEMHPELQSKFLRVLETAEFIKVGDTKITRVDVRIIAATNRNLENEARENQFRPDLFYRLNVFAITLPPLRKRIEDIPLLTAFYVSFFAAKMNKKLKGVTPAVNKILQQLSWKGNIRELKNIIERAVILTNDEWITETQLPLDLQNELKESSPSFGLAEIERFHIQKVLNHTKGNKTETARLLNIGLTTLYRKIEEYKISSIM